MMKKINRSFYLSNTIEIAKNLLGKVFFYQSEHGKILLRIEETEAYLGKEDLASHARHGKTKRNQAMYLEGGHLYIYLIYGLHYMLNIVTGEKGSPSAVLIRKAKIIEGFDCVVKFYKNNLGNTSKKPTNFLDGPGKICKALGIDLKFNQLNLLSNNIISLFEDNNVQNYKYKIIKSKRIGIINAKKWKDKLFRFTLKG